MRFSNSEALHASWGWLRKSIGIVLLLAAAGTVPASGEEIKANQLFGAKELPTMSKPMVIGGYAKGCLSGAVQLPESGPTWQAMRLSRNRHWGHPILIDYLIDLSERARDLGWKGLYIGDLNQPRGGPMTSGHASHQSGLDADIWLMPPPSLELSVAEREEISAVSVRTADQAGLNDKWTDTHMQVLKAAADNPLVDRIFVTAPIKLEMCKTAGEDRAWLQRIRPYYGHHYHFHVRLKCPPESETCITQTPTVAELSNGGDGCDKSLEWWVTAYLDSLKKPPPDPPPPRPRGARDYVMADLPEQCQQVLNAP